MISNIKIDGNTKTTEIHQQDENEITMVVNVKYIHGNDIIPIDNNKSNYYSCEEYFTG